MSELNRWTASTPRRVGAIIVSALLPGAGHVLLQRNRAAFAWLAAKLTFMAAVVVLGPVAPVLELSTRLGSAVHTVFAGTGRAAPEPMGKLLVQAALLVVLYLGLSTGLSRYVTESLTVGDGSMYPTLETGDFTVIDKTAYGASLPFAGKVSENPAKLGELVAYENPDKPDELTFGRVLLIGPGSFSMTAGAPIGVERKLLAGECTVVEADREKGGAKSEACLRFEERVGNLAWTTAQPVKLEGKASETREVPAGSIVVGQDYRRGDRPWRIVSAEAVKGRPIMVWFSTAGPAGVRWHRVGRRLP